MRAVWVMSFVAGLFWFFLFSPWTSVANVFWPLMVAATGMLALTGFLLQENTDRIYGFRLWHLVSGAVSAVLLYGIFFIGEKVLKEVFPGSAEHIGQVYDIRTAAPEGLIVFLLLFCIGPAEEVFWRGCIQQRCVKHCGERNGLVLAVVLYALVHIWSLNPVLVLASGVCGLWWGLHVAVFRNLWPGIISHALWDVMVFIAFPLHG